VKKSGIAPALASAKPRIIKKDDVVLATFQNLADEKFQVFGLEGPRGYLRPSAHEVEGYLQAMKKSHSLADAAGEGPAEELLSKSGLLKTRSRAIVYGSATAPTVISLKSNEVISAMVNLGPQGRLVATSRIDQKIGFHAKSADRQTTYLIELYLIEPTGYVSIGYRVRAKKANYPQIKVLDLHDQGVLLTVDDQAFKVGFEKAKK